MRRSLILFLMLEWLIALPAVAAPVVPIQNQISTPNITCMDEDEDGFIWIGTERGLNRFNGTAYRVYYQEDGVLEDDAFKAVCCDSDGTVWYGTTSGLGMIREGVIVPGAERPVGRIGSIRRLGQHQILFSTREGLFTLRKETLDITPVYLNPTLMYNSFHVLSDGHVWILNNASGEMIVLNEEWRTLREFQVPGVTALRICEWTDGTVFICTQAGLLHFSNDGTPLPVPDELGRLTGGEAVLFMVRGGSDAYIGIRNKGIFRIGNNSVRREWEEEDLANTDRCNVLLTRENLWISKDGGELTNLYCQPRKFTLSLPDTYTPDALNMFYAEPGGNLLIITNRGIFRQSLSSRRFSVLRGDGMTGDNKIGITLIDKQGQLWLLYNYSFLRKYRIGQDDLQLLQEWPVETTNSIWDDAAGNVYMLQADHILQISPNGQTRHIPVENHPDFWFCGQFDSGQPYFLAEDAIWLLEGGSRFVRQETGVPIPTCVWEDHRGDWWIGSRSDGVFRWTPKEGRLEATDLGGDGVDKCIRSIKGDRSGNIWIAARFDFTRISPDGEITVLNGDRYANNTNSLAITANGTPVFGSTTRLSYFMNGSIPQPQPVPVTLDGLIVNGETILSDLSAPLVFDHKTRQIVFYFSGKNFNPDFHPLFQYKLDGYDKDWVYAGNTLRAGYSALPSGKYIFRVRVLQTDGLWSGDGLSRSVRIKTSPWLSWPAMLVYLLLGALLLWQGIRAFVQFQVNREKLEISQQEKGLVEQISQERTTFFTNVSHEFRTPLSLIYGPVKELNQSPTLSEHDRSLVRLVERNAERMLRLTDQLLHFNRTRDTLDSLTVMRVDLVVLLRKMLQNFEYMFQQKDLRAETVFPSELIAWCDREKVERIIFNLLSNAVKYTPEHGQITITARQDGPQAVIEVADTGIGIAPDKAERIFERYQRLGEQVSGSLPSGFGIGLNFARHLADIHKGSLSVRSNDPIGSVFTFAFPCGKDAYAAEAIWQDNEAETSAPETEPEAADGQKAVVLVVEDNPDMREYIRGFLSTQFHIIMAGDGEEAWRLVRLNAPDLIISDVMMPYKDGYTLCKEIKNDADFCHIPVVLLTAKAEMEDQLHGLDLGADGYLGKPFDPALLTALVRNLLANRRRLQSSLADRTSATQEPVEADGLSAQDKAFLEKCYRIIDEHIAEEEFGVTVLSMEMGMSRTSIFSKLKALTGQSPQNFLTNYRLNRAMELLKAREWNVSEVAYKVGFSTLTGFSRSFKNKFGIPPSQV